MSKKMLVLKSSDGELFEIEEAIALQSQTISLLVEDDCANNEIPLANVTSHILSMVIDYCKKHAGGDSSSSSSSSDELENWDAEFMKSCDQPTIFNLILAANYLNIKSLLDLTCQTVADLISGKTPDEIREIFDIENDFTPEEEEAIRKENEWAFK